MKGVIPCTLAVLALAMTCAADELRLKDGTKIVGTIVSYEGDSFKVETSYGFAVVKKDKVASIIFSEAKPEPKKEEKKPAAPPAREPSPAAANPASPKVTPAPAPAPSATSASSPAAAKPAPPKVAVEQPMRETVEGNAYINHTYGFRMYKPPSWQVIEGARKLLPSAIVAMGTDDQTTLLVVGRSALQRGSLDAHVNNTERQLRQIYENYRPIGEESSVVAGMPAIERRFRGTVDEHEWSGVLVAFIRGTEVFTILGMTYADSDLIQIQENVIAKAVASIEFLPQ